jgi:ribose transport system ATP-binding protein
MGQEVTSTSLESPVDMSTGEISLEARGLGKSFGATRALRGVDLRLRAGRVHALLGANGCGKSTLVKILSGYHKPDAGEIHLAGQADMRSIAFVHQDLGLVPALSVTENLALAAGFRTRFGGIAWRAEHRQAAKLLADNGVNIDVREPIAAYGPAEQTMVAITRALASLPKSGGILVLDEPTARLPASEADRLVKMLGRLKSRAVAILYITHRLDEVMQLADEVTVLRDGMLIYHDEINATDRPSLVRMIAGGEVEHRPHQALEPDRTTVLEIRGLTGVRLRDISLSIGAGEIMGIAGLVGSGRSELGRAIFGLQAPVSGSIAYRGEDVTAASVMDRVERGMAYVPQERKSGLFQGLSVGENVVLADIGSTMGRFGISQSRTATAARAVVSQLLVKTEGIDIPIESLSGGNQQKVSLGKWLRRDISLLILDEPTQGIDVGARTELFHIIRQMAHDRGIAALVLDSDIEILAEHCDRVSIMTQGRITKNFGYGQFTINSLNEAVYGQ